QEDRDLPEVHRQQHRRRTTQERLRPGRHLLQVQQFRHPLQVIARRPEGTMKFPPMLAYGFSAAAVLAAVAMVPSPADAATTTLYVATDGSDSNAGTLAAPLRTIQRAVDLVAAGGTIAVRGGTYALTTTVTIAKSGTASAPITLTAYNGERPVIDA